MSAERRYYRPELERADRATLERRQLTRLQDQLQLLLTGNPFYRSRLEAAGLREAAALADVGVYTSPRLGAIRFAPHIYNDDTDVDRALEQVERVLGQRDPAG